MAYRPLTLHPDRDPWDQQPNESARCFARFVTHRDTPPHERSYRSVSESYRLAEITIRKQAEAHRWDERVAAWDAEQSRRHQARIAHQAERLARAQVDVALAMTNAVARSVQHILQSGVPLDPSNAARWLDIAARVGRMAQQQPEQVVAVTGPSGGPVEIAEFEGLTPEEKRARATEMAEGVLRLYEGGREGAA